MKLKLEPFIFAVLTGLTVAVIMDWLKNKDEK